MTARLVGITLVHGYRLTVGRFVGGRCRYYPSCSQYALDALRLYGLGRGSVLAGWRLLRCNPWSYGGVDYAEDQGLFGRPHRPARSGVTRRGDPPA